MDFRADIYSLGCTLYHMLSGKKPYESGQEQSPMSIMVRQIHDPPPAILKVLPTCPLPVVLLLNKMLAKHPTGRHASYDELIADMRRVHDMLGQPQPVAPVSPAPAGAAAKKKSAAMIWAATAGVAVLLAVGLFVWAPWKDRNAGILPAQPREEVEQRRQDAGGKPPPAVEQKPERKEEPKSSAATEPVAQTAPAKPPEKKTETAASSSGPISPPDVTRQVGEFCKELDFIPYDLPQGTGVGGIDWSPLGETVLFGLFVPRKLDFRGDTTFAVDLNKKRISPWFVQGLSCLKFSPDGQTVVASRLNDAGVVIVDVAERRTTECVSAICRFPTFTRDGRRMCFGRFENGWNIWIANKDGTGHQQLTFKHRWAADPDVSPTEDFAAYTCEDGLNVLRLDGEETALYRVNHVAGGLRWSKDGMMIAFPGPDNNIWTMDKNGKARMRITDERGKVEGQRAWSPDGTRLIYFVKEANRSGFKIVSVDLVGVRQRLGLVSPAAEVRAETPALSARLTWASEAVIEGVGWGELKLGMSEQDMFKLLGSPDGRDEEYDKWRNSQGAFKASTYKALPGVTLITSPSRGLFQINFYEVSKATLQSGIGIGSPQDQVLKTYEGRATDSPKEYGIECLAKGVTITCSKANGSKVSRFMIYRPSGQASRLAPATSGRAQSGQPFITSIGMELVYIPPGEFMLGSTKEEQAWVVANNSGRTDLVKEGNQPRKATIKNAFWLGRTEVTVGQWKQFVTATSYVTDGEKQGSSHTPQGEDIKAWGLRKGASWKDPNFGFGLKDDHPVSCITWNDAMTFCKWLNEREQKAGRLPTGYKIRLPTEAEWEYACRAGKQTRFWWGDTTEGAEERLNWFGKADGFEFVSPVDHYGARGRNRFGLADMLGNVGEWCLDEFDPTEAHEELFTGNTKCRVLRGGSFHRGAHSCRSAYRNATPECLVDFSCSGTGFRVCCGVEPSGTMARTGATSTATQTPAQVAGVPPSVDATFVKDVAALPPEQQVARVVARLKELNPGFDGKETHKVEAGAVTELAISTMSVTDIAPLKALKWLKKLVIVPPTLNQKGTLADLAPLQGLPLTWLWCHNNPITDLTPLLGMPLTVLSCGGTHVRDLASLAGMRLTVFSVNDTEVSDLSPLQDMPLTVLWCNNTKATDLAPIRSAPLQEIKCDFVPARDDATLRGIRSLAKINDMAAGAFWARVGGTPPPTLSLMTSDRRPDKNLARAMITKGEVIPIPAKNDQAYVIGPLPARSVIYLQYVQGKWKSWGNIATACPDDPQDRGGDNKGGERNRLVIANVSPTGKQHILAIVAPKTQQEPFFHIVSHDVEKVVLRINDDDGDFASNPGDVKYRIYVQTPVTQPNTPFEPAALSGTQKTMTTSIGMELVWIPPGEFLMGSTPEERAWAVQNGCNAQWVQHEGAAPRKTVIKQGFWLGKTEVTVGQWKLFVAATGYVTDGEKKGESQTKRGQVEGASWKDPNFGFKLKDNHAVSYISWNDAVAFCAWLNEREAKAGRLPPWFKVRLPTEAEWEYACRAGKQTKFWWGETKEGGDNRLNLSVKGDGFEFVSPVDHYGLRGRNKFGLADMLGNVWEW
ncbi:MAG: SUMF1/EgtB/PvdO family nonheme iron enzyme, partial [Verrucomicrobia bacterium]|nr:SUMF1/EgtB/PvdO family nonheme iron enzyme [Verrucomicrobiota bacterium]